MSASWGFAAPQDAAFIALCRTFQQQTRGGRISPTKLYFDTDE
jgi:hypothetical protein